MRIASQCIACASGLLERSPAILMPFVAHQVFGWTPVEITSDWGLRTIPAGMAYPLCNSVECQACGTLFLDIRFDEAEMEALIACGEVASRRTYKSVLRAARTTDKLDAGANPVAVAHRAFQLQNKPMIFISPVHQDHRRAVVAIDHNIQKSVVIQIADGSAARSHR